MIEQGLRTYLLANVNVSTLVGARIEYLILPKESAYPAITYQKITGPRVRSLSGPSGRAEPLIQVNCWGDSGASAKILANTVRRELDGFSGTMGSVTVDSVSLQDEQDSDPEFLPGETPDQVFRTILEFRISHLET